MFTKKIDDEIQLALVQPSFAKDFLRIRNDNLDYLSQWLAWPPHCDNEDAFLSFIRTSLQHYAEGKSLTCVIIYKGNLVGAASLNSIDHNLSRAEIGYWLEASAQGNGIVTRACLALLDIIFEELKLEKAQLRAAVDNRASRAVAERLGMTLEGVITRNENLNGRVVDHAVYGLLKSHQ
ncbi:GNAT family N-acetyltransferase [Vibrio sp. S9_S30]|uniref:GNAT family N-acetyltransferase n=1 Tax=Vibrio sp. S9_S30 TaxID=2720226 RepID=UPI00168100B3|nr:GNAT family protein [Vibrio sp. S9_S30]MBD1558183.1 GNAT family N-acetyltransferase [Vibrio sp. S9_S30]